MCTAPNVNKINTETKNSINININTKANNIKINQIKHSIQSRAYKRIRRKIITFSSSSFVKFINFFM